MITKEEIIKKGIDIISPEYMGKYYKKELLHFRTSGSSGTYLDILWDKADYQRSLLPLYLLRRKYYGISPEDRLAFFFTPGIESEDVLVIDNQLGFSKRFLNYENLGAWYDKFISFKPVWMILQPSTAVIICNFIKNNGLAVPETISYIEFSGETLHEDVRKMVEDMFGCKTANQYGATEFNSIAYECPYGNMHVLTSNVYLEIIDEAGNVISDTNNIKRDTYGDVLLSSNTNKAMRLEHYKIGDKAKLIHSSSCSCGNKKPILELMSGRANDFISLGAVDRTSSYALVQIMDDVNTITDGAILQFYAEQKAYDKIYLKLFTDDEVVKEEILYAIEQAKYNSILDKFSFSIEFADDFFDVYIEGKYCYFKNLIEQENGKTMNSEDKNTLLGEISSTIKLCISMLSVSKKRIVEQGSNSASPYDEFYEELLEMIDAGNICDAEDLMYDNMVEENREYLAMMLKVYEYLNELTDDYLEEHDFSREEVKAGVDELAANYFPGMEELF